MEPMSISGAPSGTDLGMPAVATDTERAVLLAAPRGYCAGVGRPGGTREKGREL
jgi:4-hydroxy-3-methylbut-2-enyl diphosphate reductase